MAAPVREGLAPSRFRPTPLCVVSSLPTGHGLGLEPLAVLEPKWLEPKWLEPKWLPSLSLSVPLHPEPLQYTYSQTVCQHCGVTD